MSKIFKRMWTRNGKKNSAYGFTIQMGGRQIKRSSMEWTRRDAERERAKAELTRGRPRDAHKKTLADACEMYVELTQGKRSIKNDLYHLELFKRAFGEKKPLREISAGEIAAYHHKRSQEISRRGTRVSPAAVNREVATLRHLLHLVCEREWIDRVPRIRLARESEGRLRFLTEDEVTRLLGACRASSYTWLCPIVVIAIHTGMRRGEILGLTWDRIDFSSRGWPVIILTNTKNKRSREIPMNETVYEVFSALPRAEEGRVFKGVTPGGLRAAFDRACREVKLLDVTFHTLRHTFASHLVMSGRSLRETQDLLGHQSLSMTVRYAHLGPEARRDAVAALDDRFISAKSEQSKESEASEVMGKGVR